MRDQVLLRVQEVLQKHVVALPSQFRVGSHCFAYGAERFFPVVRACSGRVAFVDGGLAELVAAPHFSVFLIRAYKGMWDSGACVSRVHKEGFAIIRAVQKEGKFFFVTEVLGLGVVLPEIAFDDPALRVGERVTPQAVASVVRHCVEWALIDSCENVQCVVRDGALDECPEDFFREKKSSNCMHVGVCKTTTALTDTGVSVPLFLSQQKKGAWVFVPEEQSVVKIGFARLHAKADRVYRIDVVNGSLEEAAALLASQSCDASFLGYPYGLVDADCMAAVKEGEKKMLRQLFFAKCVGLEHVEQAADAHDVLNTFH